MKKIQSIKAREILDSRGNPTVEAELILESGARVTASVPSGASTGTHEAVELRDGDAKRYGGKGVAKACRFVETDIASAVISMDPVDLPKIDAKMIEVDGTENKARLGANAILAVSLAMAKAGALLRGLPLYRHLAALYGVQDLRIPTPLLNIINGGKHADNNLMIQEFMIVPEGAPTFREALRLAAETFHKLKGIIAEKKDSTAVGDEGGFAPRALRNPEEAMEMLLLAIERSGHAGKIRISLDLAATEFFESGKYRLFSGQNPLPASQVIQTLKTWTSTYPIASMEDPLAEDDWDSWKALTKAAGHETLLVGDDLFVTNPKRLERGIKEGTANAILIKPNQIGSVTETAQVVKLAKSKGYATIASHRSGETEDAALAHLAVGLGTEGIKTGSVSRSERLAKYNELLRIEEELGEGKYRGELKIEKTIVRV